MKTPWAKVLRRKAKWRKQGPPLVLQGVARWCSCSSSLDCPREGVISGPVRAVTGAWTVWDRWAGSWLTRFRHGWPSGVAWLGLEGGAWLVSDWSCGELLHHLRLVSWTMKAPSQGTILHSCIR